MKKQTFLLYPFILMGLFFVFASSCKKDDDKGFPELSTSEVTKIAQKTAQSGGIITSDGGFVITARGVCWSKSSNPTIADNKTSDGSGAGSFSSEITGLTAGETYYVRAYATNSKGTSYGSTMIFQTVGSTFTDSRDSNVYQIVIIGNQLWLAENLKYLPGVVEPTTGSQTTPCYYVYGYNGATISEAKATFNYNTYGVLYNWPAATAACPSGWHLPSVSEWTQLADSQGGASVAGGKLKESGTDHWWSPNASATNQSEFRALPGGLRGTNGDFGNAGRYGYWWSSTENSATNAWIYALAYDNGMLESFHMVKDPGFSVRCVRVID
jgi:uncharacterized protein (TIGR02145 family)